MCAKSSVRIFLVPPYLVEVEVVILKYVSRLHSLNSSARRRKEAHTCSLAHLPLPGLAKGVRHLREWSAEIRLLALRERSLLLQFWFLVSWPSSLQSPKRFRS